jgi:hypothetical protein
MTMTRERLSPEAMQEVNDALAPPNAIDPTTGLPYGWSEENELDGLDGQLTG